MTAEELVHGNESSYSLVQFVADSLTLMRLFISVLIVVIGAVAGAGALNVAIICVLLAWITDYLDGVVARSTGCPESWVGRLDHLADNVLVYSFFLFLVITGLFPVVPGLLLLGACGVIMMTRPTEPVIQMVSAPFFGLPIVLAPLAGWIVFGCFVLFLGTIIVLRWDKLKGFATNAHHEASGQVDERSETGESM
ncbi:MAG: CDP-alcohol phosphatidyltransferase family protein [Actinobacteria bacterium]|nr:CDP-alcohol phosphatidyltransferase family protein [Actinomycetota bacterium]